MFFVFMGGPKIAFSFSLSSKERQGWDSLLCSPACLPLRLSSLLPPAWLQWGGWGECQTWLCRVCRSPWGLQAPSVWASFPDWPTLLSRESGQVRKPACLHSLVLPQGLTAALCEGPGHTGHWSACPPPPQQGQVGCSASCPSPRG